MVDVEAPGFQTDGAAEDEADVAVRIKGLRKVYGRHQAVKNLSFSMHMGHITALLGNPRSRAPHQRCGPAAHQNIFCTEYTFSVRWLQQLTPSLTAHIGHNGAGKTTTVGMLTGMLRPTSGDCEILGHSIVRAPSEVRRHMGICPQQNVLFGQLSVWEHLLLYSAIKGIPGVVCHCQPGSLITASHTVTPTHSTAGEQVADFCVPIAFATQFEHMAHFCSMKWLLRLVSGGAWGAAAVAASEEMLSAVGLADKRHTAAAALSGGMKRKLQVGLALLGGSEVVLLDEPSSGRASLRDPQGVARHCLRCEAHPDSAFDATLCNAMDHSPCVIQAGARCIPVSRSQMSLSLGCFDAGMDPVSRRGLWALLRQHKEGRALLLTTHYMDEADLLSDRIAILGEGQLRCIGSSLQLKVLAECCLGYSRGASAQTHRSLRLATSSYVSASNCDQALDEMCRRSMVMGTPCA